MMHRLVNIASGRPSSFAFFHDKLLPCLTRRGEGGGGIDSFVSLDDENLVFPKKKSGPLFQLRVSAWFSLRGTTSATWPLTPYESTLCRLDFAKLPFESL